jgi:hypothetical protein
MHNAPPVVFPVGRFVWGRWILVLLALIGAFGLYFVQSLGGTASLPWAWAWASALWAVLVMVSLFIYLKEWLTEGSLAWSGEAWCWRDARGHETGIQLVVLADVGSALWVAVRMLNNAGWPTQRFAWMVGREMPQAWHGFRCAVYSRPRPERKMAEREVDEY